MQGVGCRGQGLGCRVWGPVHQLGTVDGKRYGTGIERKAFEPSTSTTNSINLTLTKPLTKLNLLGRRKTIRDRGIERKGFQPFL